MVIYTEHMTISVTELKAHCLEIIRKVESERKSIEVVRRGEVVAVLVPAPNRQSVGKPWERLRGTGKLLTAPEEGVLEDQDFEALH
jgi:prevent-host-death family protein